MCTGFYHYICHSLLCRLNDHNITEYCWSWRCTTSRQWVTGVYPKSRWLFILNIKGLHSWRDSYWQFSHGYWNLNANCYFKVIIALKTGDNDTKWHLLLKLIAFWHVWITIYDYFYYCFCLIELHQKAIRNRYDRLYCQFIMYMKRHWKHRIMLEILSKGFHFQKKWEVIQRRMASHPIVTLCSWALPNAGRMQIRANFRKRN